ncbi:hypothetical protein G5V59_22935 [Nocardioides sp. W3-2-3]|uniref:hypothetical protein n=1 Tax=Nocardioides convexus TaxID=2712224 RepID=UPI002418530C|nr:hypothetical protein [Nocardioides convexus]NHA01639.1 hypothetical protein [Nocardioides convexus]
MPLIAPGADRAAPAASPPPSRPGLIPPPPPGGALIVPPPGPVGDGSPPIGSGSKVGQFSSTPLSMSRIGGLGGSTGSGRSGWSSLPGVSSSPITVPIGRTGFAPVPGVGRLPVGPLPPPVVSSGSTGM